MKKKSNKPEFKIRLNDGSMVIFVPNHAFNNWINSDYLLKVLTSKKIVIRVNAINENAYVNFNIGAKIASNGTKYIMFGHVNYFDNDLDDDSSDKDKSIVIKQLHELLKKVKFKDIHTSQKTEREPGERYLKKRDAINYI